MNDPASEKPIEITIDEQDEGSLQVENLVALSDFLEKLKIQFLLKENEMVLIDGELTLHILERNTNEECLANIKEHLELEKNTSVEQVLTSIRTFLETMKVEQKQEPVVENTTETPPSAPVSTAAPTSAEILTSINERFNQSTTVLPITRNQSIERKEPTKDPYHEPLED